MRSNALTLAAATVMLAMTAMAAALIWIAATDPLSVAASAAAGDVWMFLEMVGERMLALVW